MNDEDLKKKLENDMEHQYIVARKEIRSWNPTRFYQMLKEHGGYETAFKLLSKKEPSEGFIKLLQYNKIKLSTEWLILNGNNGKYKSLFPEEMIKECEKRLKIKNNI